MKILWLMLILIAVAILRAQTQIGPNQQQLPTVTQFATCSGSGTGTIPNCTPQPISNCTVTATNTCMTVCTYQWDCSGLSMFQFKLPNGTIAGPYIAIPITPPGGTGVVNWINQLVTVPSLVRKGTAGLGLPPVGKVASVAVVAPKAAVPVGFWQSVGRRLGRTYPEGVQ
jgi:hypothetical protein